MTVLTFVNWYCSTGIVQFRIEILFDTRKKRQVNSNADIIENVSCLCVLCYIVTFSVWHHLALGIASNLVNQLRKVYYVCSMWEKYLVAHSQHDLFMGYFMMQQCASILLCNIYSTVGRSIADISYLRWHIYQGAKCRGKYAAKVEYRGYRPIYRAIYTI